MSSADLDPDAERDLIGRAQDGDQRALDTLLRVHYDRIYAVCRRIAGNDADALDATQDALIAIVRGLPRFDGRARFGTWAYRVASNACLDELRRRKRRADPGLPEVEEAPEGGAPLLDQQISDRLALDEALGRLRPEWREPVVLRDIGGLDYAEIADQLGIPPGTVRSRIARGRRHLSEILRTDDLERPHQGSGNQNPSGDRPRTQP